MIEFYINKDTYIIAKKNDNYVYFGVLNVKTNSFANYNLDDEQLEEVKQRYSLTSLINLYSKDKYISLPHGYIKRYVSDDNSWKESMLNDYMNIFRITHTDNEYTFVEHIFYDVKLKVILNSKEQKIDEYNELRKRAIEQGLIQASDKITLKELRDVFNGK